MVNHYKHCELSDPIKIAELGEAFSTMNLSKEQLSDTGKECIIYGELFTLYGCVIDKVQSRTQVSKGLTLSSGHDLLFPASTTVDAISLIAPSSLNKKDVVLGGDMFGIKVTNNYSVEYLSYFFNYIAKHQLAKYAQGSTIIHLHYNNIAHAKICLPILEEQEKIVVLIQKMQAKLDLENSILFQIESLKKYLLDQLFI